MSCFNNLFQDEFCHTVGTVPLTYSNPIVYSLLLIAYYPSVK